MTVPVVYKLHILFKFLGIDMLETKFFKVSDFRIFDNDFLWFRVQVVFYLNEWFSKGGSLTKIDKTLKQNGNIWI